MNTFFKEIAWFNLWRAHIEHANKYPEYKETFCKHAMKAQMQYLCLAAQYWAAFHE